MTPFSYLIQKDGVSQTFYFYYAAQVPLLLVNHMDMYYDIFPQNVVNHEK